MIQRRPLLLTLAGMLAALIVCVTPTRAADGLRVHFISVGQGEAILIEGPAGEAVLIDGGPDGTALAYLQQTGITELTAVIVSHPHEDHITGLIDVLQALPVAAVWTSGAVHTTSTFENLIDAIIEQQIPYNEAATGDTITAGGLTFDVLHSDPDAPDLNDSSLVLHLTYGRVSFLFAGDASASVESRLLQTTEPARLTSTVLKVAHHGSSDATTAEFLAAVQPAIAVYSAGKGNPYGHPDRSTIDRLQAAGAAVYGTDTSGTIIVATDGQAYTVTTASTSAPISRTVTGSRAVTGLRYDPNGPDRNCTDFTTHAEAQAFYLAAGGPDRDPHELDGDADGDACETLP